MKVIGLTGFAKSGKSTAAETLKSLGGKEVAFAKHLKDVCAVVFNIPRDHFDNQDFKEAIFKFDRIILKEDIDRLLTYFEVPARFIPETILKHQGIHLVSPRHTAQYIGTEVLRGIDQNIHIKMAFKLNYDSDSKFLICSDVRFANELEAVRDAGGIVIGVSRNAAIPKDLENLHPSEREIPSLTKRSDIVIFNEKTMQDFQESIREKAVEYLDTK